MSESVVAQGTVIKIATSDSPDSPGEYIEIKEVNSFDGPDGSAATIDVTHLRSTRREFRMGLPDEGQFTFSLNYLPDDPGQLAAKAARSAMEKRQFRVEYTDGSIDEFDGYVLSFSRTGAVDGILQGSMVVKIDGEITES